MKLVIGGCAQGKLTYVEKNYKPESCKIWDGEIPEQEAEPESAVILNHFHNWVRRRIAEKGCPEEEILLVLAKYPDCIIICDEIGNGIVPVEAFEREYRERLGRIQVALAKRAESVERVLCGIGQKIK